MQYSFQSVKVFHKNIIMQKILGNINMKDAINSIKKLVHKQSLDVVKEVLRNLKCEVAEQHDCSRKLSVPRNRDYSGWP